VKGVLLEPIRGDFSAEVDHVILCVLNHLEHDLRVLQVDVFGERKYAE
jgi:hypothetical protein